MRVKQDHDSADLLNGELDFGCPQLAVANPSEPVIDLGPNYLTSLYRFISAAASSGLSPSSQSSPLSTRSI